VYIGNRVDSKRNISLALFAPASAAPSTPNLTTFITSLASSLVNPASVCFEETKTR
jgi:hypothetical protein